MNTQSATSVDDDLLITAGGYEDLRVELERLRDGVGPELSERLRDARQDGHLADNPLRVETRTRLSDAAGDWQRIHYEHQFVEGELEEETRAAGLTVVFHDRGDGTAVLTANVETRSQVDCL